MANGRLPIVSERKGGESEEGSPCGKLTVAVPKRQPRRSARSFSGNVALVTLGCAKNEVDSEVMLGVLTQEGFRAVRNLADADLIVVNTCAFLESAVTEGIDVILDLAQYKSGGRCRQLVVAGCLVERYRSELQAALPEVDRFLSTDEILAIGDATPTTASCFDAARRPYFLYDESAPRLLPEGASSAYIKIAEGCDRPCSFCIIPKLRGAFRSRSITSVTDEARVLFGRGVREVILVAQDLTNYGADRGGSGMLEELLRALSGLSDIRSEYWVRLLYAYPIGVTRELIELIADSPWICNYLDLPLQHISHNVLKRMRRPLGERRTRELIEMIRERAPDIALRTTFIVGFPGETEGDVELLRSFIEEEHFLHVGVFPYSNEEEALSSRFEDQIPERIRMERQQLLMEAQQRVVERRLRGMVGRRFQVLVEGDHPESTSLLVARTEFQAPDTDGVVIVNDVSSELAERSRLGLEGGVDRSRWWGRFGEVEITGVAGYDLVGTLLTVESEGIADGQRS